MANYYLEAVNGRKGFYRIAGKNPIISISIIPGHFTTGNAHINNYLDVSGLKSNAMVARVSQKVGQEYNPNNHLIMYDMGPIVASTIGSALVAGIFIALFGG
jgi:hypothetical protein